MPGCELEFSKMQRANDPAAFDEAFRKRGLSVRTTVLQGKILFALPNQGQIL